jgi:hypothetical protein
MPAAHNPETDSNVAPVDHELRIEVRGFAFRIGMVIPGYIFAALKSDSEAWSKIVSAVRVRAENLLIQAAQFGYVGQTAYDAAAPMVGDYARVRVYEVFQDLQAKRGNEAWAVPVSLQPGASLIVEV